MKKHLFLTSIYLLLIIVPIVGQISPNLEEQRERREQQRKEELARQQREIKAEMNKAAKLRLPVRGRYRIPERKPPLSPEEEKRVKALRTPNPEDSAKYKEFLEQPNTGLFRLFPDLGCEAKNLVRVDGECANAVPSSWAYSFRRKDYISSDFFDVHFKEGNLIADGFLSQEILVTLGDIPLENVSLTSGGMKFLADFRPGFQIQEAKKQFKQIAETIVSGNYRYGKSVRADLNTTYALRLVAYRNDEKKVSRLSPDTMSVDERRFWDLEYDKRADLTLAIRIVRRDQDGGITILWKELNRRQAPRIVFGENDKLSDIKE